MVSNMRRMLSAAAAGEVTPMGRAPGVGSWMRFVGTLSMVAVVGAAGESLPVLLMRMEDA